MGTFPDNKLKAFEGWLFIEVYMIAFIIVANCIFLGMRSLDRGRIVMELGGEKKDRNQDFLGCG